MTHSDAYYHTVAAAFEGRTMLSEVGPLARPMSAGFVRGGGSHWLRDAYGRERWLNTTGMRVYGECLRVITAGTQVTATAMAAGLGVCDQTVRRWVLKLTAWGLIGSATARGRYGGLVLFARAKRDNLERYAQAARDRLRAAWVRRNPFAFQSDTHTDKGVGTVGVELEFQREREAREQAFAEAIGVDPSRPRRRVACPAHQGDGLNVSWWWMSSGTLGVKCWSHGCSRREMLQATGLWRA